VSLCVCAVCGGGAQRAGGELVPVEAAVVAMAACDAQHLGEGLPGGADVVPGKTALRAANENASLDAGRTVDVGESERSDHAHVGAQRATGTILSKHAADRDHPSPRAKQSIPPALRRQVLTRDRHRCRIPGCTHATFVDVHHIQPRSEGGCNAASNLLTLCSAHHRAVHRGALLIERDGEGATSFRHADGAAYGQRLAPRLIDAHAKVFSALRQLGFREREVKAVLSALRDDAELIDASVEHLLREALRRIEPMAR
jgi:hypothetical protein